MSYELETILRHIENELEAMAERDLAFTRGYGILLRKRRMLRGIIRVFRRWEVAR